MNMIVEQTHDLQVSDFQDVLRASGLSARRPVDDRGRLERMLKHSNLVVVAKEVSNGKVVGVARSLTDYAYCCYLSDLAVDKEYQGHGLGKRLIEKTRELAGPEAMCLLLSSPDAMPFYKAIGMPQPDNAFLYKRER